MAQTKEKLISDIILKITQSNPSDDLALEEDQVAYWISLHLNDLIRREIIEEQKKGNMIPPIYIRRDVVIEPQEESITNVSAFNQRIYIELPEEVVDLPRDGGIVRLLDYDRNLIHKTSVEQLEDLRNLHFAKPSPENPVYYREGKTNNKIFIEGFNTADIDFNPFMCSYIPKQDIISMADGDEVLITDQLVPILRDLCVQEGKEELYGSEPDKENDGVDNKKIQYHTAIQNPVNQDQQLNTDQQ
jgi:hypothetical protein